MKKTISFEIELDENHLAEKIKMSSADSDKDIDKIKSIYRCGILIRQTLLI